VTADTGRLRALDRAARRHAATEFETPLLLRAGAGTGKTATLVARVVAYCLGPGFDRARARLGPRGRDPGAVAARVLDGVVAITFTEAAAAEMAERVGAALRRVAGGEALPPGLEPDLLDGGARGAAPLAAEELQARAAALAGALDHLLVSTIHSFCHRLIAAHPFELGLHPQLRIDASGEELEALVHGTVAEWLGSAYGAEADEDWLRLARLGIGPPEIAAALLELLRAGARAEHLEPDPLGPAAVRECAQRLRGSLQRLLELTRGMGGQFGSSKTSRATLEAAAAAHSRLELGPYEVVALREAVGSALLQGSESARLVLWAKNELGKIEDRVFGELAGAIAAAASELVPQLKALAQLDAERLQAGRAVLAPLLRELRERQRRSGLTTFDDLLTHAVDLLRNDAQALERERRRIDQLLVDEFQDTDERQCDLVRWLALQGPREERPGLFVVGDPQQSIYGWRRADLAAFEAFSADLEAEGGTVEQLYVNYRSTVAVLEEVRRVLEPVLVAEPGVQAGFAPLLTPPAVESTAVESQAPPDAGDEPPLVYRWCARAAEGETLINLSSAEATALDAEHFAAAVLERRRRDGAQARWSDHALLLRSSADLEVYLQALKRRGIPYAVGRDRSYYRRREVIDAAALVRAVIDPSDHLALVTWLRSPAVGVPDAALWPLWAAHLPELLTTLEDEDEPSLAPIAERLAQVAAALPRERGNVGALPHWPAAALAGCATLGALRAALRREPAGQFVESLRRRALLEGAEAARYLGAYRLANLERFFARLGRALEESGGDRDLVARLLRRAVAESREADEGRPREAAEDAVAVSTIHAAKGLEYRYVHLGQLHKRSGSWPHTQRTEFESYRDGARGAERVAYRLFGAPTLDFERIEARRRRTEAAERGRTLYVALTRARERLSFGLDSEAGRLAGPRPPGRAANHGHLIDARRETPSGLAAALARRAAQGEPWVDAGEVRFRLLRPDDPGLGERTPTAGRAERPGLDLSRVRAELAELADRRAAARERERRPRVAAASSDSRGLDPGAGADDTGRAGAELGDAAPPPDDGAARAARAVGTALHRLLETLRPEDVADGLGRAGRELDAALARQLSGATLASARARAEELLAALRRGPLLQRRLELEPHRLASELPVLLPADPERDGPLGPQEAFLGAVDLVYRDPRTGEVVVADYKTDRLTSGAQREERERHYTTQLARYARAVREGLQLPRHPRCELWWLASGQVTVVLDPYA
jgi:ATP-dependent helicase/nuclease subunit A